MGSLLFERAHWREFDAVFKGFVACVVFGGGPPEEDTGAGFKGHMYSSCAISTQSVFSRTHTVANSQSVAHSYLIRTVEYLGSIVSALGIGGAWHRVISMGGVRGKREVRTVCISTWDERAVIVDWAAGRSRLRGARK